MIAVDPLDVAIAAHRAAYDAFQIAPGGDDSAESMDANCAMLDAMDALVVAATAFPILTRPLPAGAGSLLAHLRWWLAEEVGQAESYQPAYGILQGRAADLAAALEGSALCADPLDTDPVVAAIVAADMVAATHSAAIVFRDEDDDESEAVVDDAGHAVDAAFRAVQALMPTTLVSLHALVKFYERDAKLYDRMSSGGDYFGHVAAAVAGLIAREARPGSAAEFYGFPAKPKSVGRGVPGQPEILAAWLALPPAERDRIGFIAVDMVWQAFLHGDGYAPEDRALPGEAPEVDAIRDRAGDACNDRLSEIHRVAEAAMPGLFGPDGQNPDWAVAMGARR